MKSKPIVPQPYPRILDENSPYYGCLDDSQLVAHEKKIAVDELKALIRTAIDYANRKSSREILSIPVDATPELLERIYEREGKKLFRYFRKYPGDPASTAHQILHKHYQVVGIEQFRNRTLQKERMNSGWRYQFLAVDSARHSGRFISVSDIGAAEGDFNAVINFLDRGLKPLSLYVSVKNRSNIPIVWCDSLSNPRRTRRKTDERLRTNNYSQAGCHLYDHSWRQPGGLEGLCRTDGFDRHVAALCRCAA